MSLPHFDFPDSPTIAGDAHDDDADVIDNLVESEARPPTPAEQPKAQVRPLDKPKPITRLLSGSLVVDKAWPIPTQLLPADPKRKSLRITVISTTATDVVRIADEQNKAQTTDAALVPVFLGGISLDSHTGAVWVFAPGLAATCIVSFVGVTE